MKKTFFYTLLLYSQVCYAQFNLVLNPSFELKDSCPDNGGQINFATHWTNPVAYASPDYFTACSTAGYSTPNNIFGYQSARTDSSYAGFITFEFNPLNIQHNIREYVQGELSDTLIAGVEYCVRFYVNLANNAKFSAGNMGIYFSDSLMNDTVSMDYIINVLPYINNDPALKPLNDTSQWIEISGSFVANGNEKYFIIGNFDDDNIIDTSINNPSGYYWSYYYVDDVLVTPCDSLVSLNDITTNNLNFIFPNPSQGIVNLYTKLKGYITISVFDNTGKIIYEPILKNNSAHKIQIDLSRLSNGMYFIRVVNNKNTHFKKLIIQH